MIKQKNRRITKVSLTDRQAGFTAVEVLIVVVVLSLIVGAGVMVAKRNNKATTSNSVTSSLSQSAVTGKTPTTSTSAAAPLSPQSTFVATPTSVGKASTTKATTGSTAKVVPKTTSTTTKLVTPLSALTTLISGLDSGQGAQVTATSVVVAGPITDAHARPLVFSVNGTVYFAYTQGSKPDFNQTAAETAGTMAITKGNLDGVLMSQVHLDKAGNLVDENEALVGYSTGGN